jgi:hypothetical protein
MYHLLIERVSTVTIKFRQYRARVRIRLNRAGIERIVERTDLFTSLGIVVKNCYGLILGAKCITMEMVADSSLAEVMGALYTYMQCNFAKRLVFMMFCLKGMPIK